MRSLAVLLVFLWACRPVAFAACYPAPAGLTDWWPASGSASDFVGTNNGALMGGASATNAAGFVGTCFSFDGTNNYVQIPDSPAFHPSNLTVEAWVRFSSLDSAGSGGSPAGEQYIVFKQNSINSSFEGFDLGKQRVSGSDYFRFIVSSSSGQSAEIRSSTVVSTGVWYHVAGVRGSNYTQLYVNGQLQRQTNVTFAQNYGTLPLYFGSSGQTFWDHKFKGLLDEVSLYNRALSSNEIAGIYAAGSAGKCGFPQIVTQPASQTNAMGASISFSATASGSTPLGYQWRFNASNIVNGPRISGATTTNLVITNIQTLDDGSYTLVASNILGTVTSAVATLTVLSPPSINLQPVGQSTVVGTNVTFTVGATGSAPLFYKWTFGGVDRPGATGTSLALNNIQPSDAGDYRAIVTNPVGSATSQIATLTVSVTPTPPTIANQPASQVAPIGGTVSFSVGVAGTAPFAYQWQKGTTNLTNGGSLSGATASTLSLTSVGLGDGGNYRVIVTNAVGAITSAPASLIINTNPQTGADAVVLVNSSSVRFLDFIYYLKPYLDNFGFAYTVQDITTNPPSQSLGKYAVIIIGHSQLDTNRTYLTTAAQTAISQVVSNGTGLVNFDNNLSIGSTPRYQFVQDIFGFSYGSSGTAGTVTLPTLAGGQMHYITSMHTNAEVITLRGNLTVAGLALAASGTSVATCAGLPFVSVRKCGLGLAMQWGSYDWMNSAILGPVDGLDDLIWRGVVWAARKPFMMRGQPNLISLRADDAQGPFGWIHDCNAVGFKPYATLFYKLVTESSAADLRNLTTNGLATASIHANDATTAFFYWDHANARAWPDNVMSNNFYVGTQWHTSHGIPISKVCATHYSEIGLNCFAGLKAWGMEYVPIEVVPGTIEYSTPGAPWLVGGPYRLYETPQPGQVNWPTYYADWLSVPGHPEFDGVFFNVYSEVRDAASCHEWCPGADVPGSITRATSQAKRTMQSQVMTTIFTHEQFIRDITTANWQATMQGITNVLAPYKPTYVTLDYASQYVRATRTSRLISCQFNPTDGQVTSVWSGKSDVNLQVQIFLGPESSISNQVVTLPLFTNGYTSVVTTQPTAPIFLSQPQSQTNNAGTMALFNAGVTGSSPLSYRWWRNGSNSLTDGGQISGASSANLTIANVMGSNTASFSLVASNVMGSVTSSPAAALVVIDPAITSQPVSHTNHAGTTASFNVTAVGTSPGFIWLKNEFPISQATNSTLVLPSVSTNDAAAYSVLVGSAYGTAHSSTANLSVLPPPAIQSFGITDHIATLSWPAIPGQTYNLQQSSNLNPAVWSPVLPSVTATGLTAVFTNSTTGTTQRFYRLLIGP